MKSISVADSSAAGGWAHMVRLDRRFAPMMSRLEGAAKDTPEAYGRKVVAAGFLGYGVLALVLLTLVGLTVAMGVWLFADSGAAAVKIKALLVFGLLAFGLFRALWVATPEPQGFPASRSEMPRLFAMVDEVRAATGGPAVHDIRIIDELNAAITQQPRFMIFGAKNTLYIGLPLMLAMTADEVRAIVAHEFGHFVGRHGKSAGFVYRIRMRWAQVAERLPTGIVAGLLRKFFAWYGPWFAAYSFALARQQEYDADRVAAQVAGAETAANALTRITIQADRFGAAWSSIWRRTSDSPRPPASPYSELRAAFGGASDADDGNLSLAIATPGDLDDTHPGLAQRLAALGHGAEIPPPLTQSAAEALFGDDLERLIARLDDEWHEYADPAWEYEHNQDRDRRAEWDALRERVESGEASAEDLANFAGLTETVEGPGAAAEAYQRVLIEEPDNLGGRFNLGRLLLDAGDDGGIVELEKAIAVDRSVATSAYHLILAFLRARGRDNEIATYSLLLQEAEDLDALAATESLNIDQMSQLQELEPAFRDRLAKLVSTVAGVKRLHAAGRTLQNGDRQVVFIFSARRGVESNLLLNDLIDAMIQGGRGVLGIERTYSNRWLVKKVEDVSGGELIGA